MNYEYKKFETLDYMLETPAGFDESKQYPVILLLHGAGGRGNDVKVIRDNPFFIFRKNLTDTQFVTFAPQCSGNTWFDHFETLRRFVACISSLSFTDSSRIYLVGPSMGGYGTWQLGMSIPEYFAAIVPICGGGMAWNADRLKNVPVWAFHGEDDDCVPCEESRKMVAAVNRTGGSAKLTVYPGVNHASWEKAYADPALYEWLLTNKSKSIKLADEKLDMKIYG